MTSGSVPDDDAAASARGVDVAGSNTPAADAAPHIPDPAAIAGLLAAGRCRDALALVGEALAAADPADRASAPLCHLAARAADALDDAVTAEAMWLRAVRLDPAEAAPWFELGAWLGARARDDDAIACLRAGLALVPSRADAWDRLGLLLLRRQRPFDAEQCHRRAVELDPDDPAPHTHLGFALEAQARADEALTSHLRALSLSPSHPAVRTNLGNVLATLGRFDEAIARHREAIALAPDMATAHCNLGVLLADLRRDDDAGASLTRALALRPGYPLARLNLGFLRLAEGRFAEGWPLHEARYDPALPHHGIPAPPWPIAPWQGEPLAGRSVLVWAEQGFGDQIQFARFVPQLKARGAGQVTLVCQRPLHALFQTLAGVDRLVAADVVDNVFVVAADVDANAEANADADADADPEAALDADADADVDADVDARDHASTAAAAERHPDTDAGTHVDADAAPALADHDLWAFPLSLPLHLGITLEDLPATPLPYLHALRAHVSARPGARRRVGLVWRGNPRHHNDADRSLPSLATLAPLWSVPGVSFVSLQAGAAAREAREAPSGQPIETPALPDFAATAEALAGTDLLICVDTSSAHLAGALGRPCWVLLPDYRTDWRWLRDRDDSPWYSGTMRLFRQPSRGDWTAVVDTVRVELRTWARQPLPGPGSG